jgi:hypothetical protein
MTADAVVFPGPAAPSPRDFNQQDLILVDEKG